MNTKIQYLGPVAISGLGGSGTRLIAEILRDVGFYMGDDLNTACDNLCFTLLCKRPKWFIKNYKENKSKIFEALHIFEKLMNGCLSPKFSEFQFILKAAIEWSVCGNHIGGIGSSGRGLWPFIRVLRMLQAKRQNSSTYIGWGWKEPNTHIYIEYLNEYFDNIKYIHVVRHGLDMAYSRNQAQLHSWGEIIGIDVRNSSVPLPKKTLQFWIKANERTISLAQKMPQGTFLLINFDKLCLNPGKEIKQLIDFLDINVNNINLKKLQQMPKLPKSSGRYKKQNLTIFNKDEIDAVRKFGFVVNL